jgi:hypothetical protein
VKKSQPVANSVSTVLGAIVGGLGAREAEQAWDKRKDRRGVDESEGEERRERRGGRERRQRRSEDEGGYH